MSDGGSLVNFGEFSKPATVLIEKVCNAVGIIYEPTRIKRKAKAEAEVEQIKALAGIELRNIEHRAIERLVHQEARKQENIESIAAEAATALSESAKVNELDEDWVAYFFKQCDTVSDKEMQSLWARLLSGEATSPGTFSKRTVNFISTIDKKDAALFTSLCQFVWVVDDDPNPLIYEIDDEIYKKQGITFASLTHLDAIGLISFDAVNGYANTELSKYGHARYYDLPISIEFPVDANNQIDIGQALFTNTGKELAAISGSQRSQEFYEYVVGKWFKDGLVLSSVTLCR